MFGFLPSIVSKLFGNKKQKEVTTIQTTRNEIDYVKLRENAEKGGFNPEFALANGGGAGHTVSHVPFTRMMGGGRNIIGHALDAFNETASGVMSAVGMGGGMPSGGFTSAFDYDPLQQQKSRLEMQIMEAQLRRLNGGVSYAKGMGAPMATGSRYKNNSKLLGVRPKPQPGKASVTNPLPVGEVNPHFVDAEQWETRYGDLAQEFGGLVNVFADTYHNVVGHYNDRDAVAAASQRTAKRLTNFGVGDVTYYKPIKRSGW